MNSSTDLCTCGHARIEHHHDGCVHRDSPASRYCTCQRFVLASSPGPIGAVECDDLRVNLAEEALKREGYERTATTWVKSPVSWAEKSRADWFGPSLAALKAENEALKLAAIEYVKAAEASAKYRDALFALRDLLYCGHVDNVQRAVEKLHTRHNDTLAKLAEAKRGHADYINSTAKERDGLRAECEDLKSWRWSMCAKLNTQEIAKLIGLTPGDDVYDAILPWIKKAMAQVARLERACAEWQKTYALMKRQRDEERANNVKVAREHHDMTEEGMRLRARLHEWEALAGRQLKEINGLKRSLNSAENERMAAIGRAADYVRELRGFERTKEERDSLREQREVLRERITALESLRIGDRRNYEEARANHDKDMARANEVKDAAQRALNQTAAKLDQMRLQSLAFEAVVEKMRQAITKFRSLAASDMKPLDFAGYVIRNATSLLADAPATALLAFAEEVFMEGWASAAPFWADPKTEQRRVWAESETHRRLTGGAA